MYLDYLGEVHGRLEIAPAMYDLWLDALLATVAECDPACDAALEAAWRDALAAGMARIKAPGAA
jgi:hemoglobin-like flavoprotein